MNRVLKLIFLSCLISLMVTAKTTQADETAQNPETIQKDFQVALAKSIAKLRAAERARKYKLKSINSSIRLTLEAADTLMQRNNYSKAESLLLESLTAYQENIIARLILADVFESQGKQEKANQAYEYFLKEGEKANQLSNDSTDFETRAAFAAYVREKLASQKIFPPKPRGYGFLPLSLRLQTGERSWLLSFVAAGIPVLMIFISIVFVFRKIFSLHAPSVNDLDKVVFGIFITCLAAYALWAVHLFLNIAPMIEPVEYEILAVLLLGIVIVLSKLMRERYLREERFRSDPVLKKCPHCKRYIEKLLVVCFFCNHEVKD